ncbi:hypothetical protein FisN_9Lh347 [Fistulifera solaris]|uniref:LysM domain-containing protein n=1 Tax=Fistulifera solaris TaxID=1519565 RepID=A0A1Z5KLX7_FISSO|nr:hypothetical protein FisN_9Lh347 [Fistulifera solaris]|eukprot:GAX27031.1 hypothetical protein FisN_9Lh347 [Fistulifera solaris]
MSEGGFFPWKVQRHVTKPSADYSRLSSPLPSPPNGMKWHQNTETREWKLVAQKDDIPELITEERAVDNLPSTLPQKVDDESEWEVLSGENPSSSESYAAPKAGSVRSLASFEGGDIASHLSSQLSHTSFKIQRTLSSSTIDSTDPGILGPSGKGILGVDYVEHVILPTDTLQGICLAYKINSTRLRQANHFSGHSLLLAPKKLVIPISQKALRSGFIRVQDTDAKQYKLHALLAAYPDLSASEASAYLELADWVLEDALQTAKEDREWEKTEQDDLKAGEIRIRIKHGEFPIGYFKGAGIQQKEIKEKVTSNKTKVVPTTSIPAIATKSVNPQDVYKASLQHNQIGVELQTLSRGQGTDM